VGGRRAQHPRFLPENFAHNHALAMRVADFAREKGCTPAQLCLAWLMAQGEDVFAIPGTRRAVRLDENLGAMAVKLTPEEVARISAAVPPGAAAGTRYPAGGMKGVFI
jgi:aryl-alcohol dehydrogenase-like predicted oxidoreductase